MSGGACAACASVNLPPCFGDDGCAYDGSRPGIGTVSLERPTGRKALRRPGMPEATRLAAVAEDAHKIGAFLEWLAYNMDITLCVYDEDAGRFAPARSTGLITSTERLLARYFGIDLDRVERERGRLLAYIREKGNA